ncbi:MAG: GNAT family N-acetyltransferase [Ignavibacteria bacterium]|nr:GNAT family N-acetyltransferase [Ignavibacteria bacterium]
MNRKVILDTDRLILREFEEEDAGFILRLLNSPGWLKNIGPRGIQTEENAKEYINSKLRKAYTELGFGFYLIELKSGGESVGMCGLVKREGLDDVDVGFALLPEYEGMGYAYEAATAIVEYAANILNISSLSAITIPSNSSSIKLLEKIGLRFSKMIRIPNDPEELMLFTNHQSIKL